MIKIGDVINAPDYRVEPYGIFFQFDSEEVFVHLPGYCGLLRVRQIQVAF